MNSDETKSLIVKVLLMILTPIGTKYGIDGNTTAAVAAWAGSGIVLAYGIWDHWNMKKAPEGAIVVKAGTQVPAAAVISASNQTGTKS